MREKQTAYLSFLFSIIGVYVRSTELGLWLALFFGKVWGLLSGRPHASLFTVKSQEG